jgi:phospholipid-binding lipoprotein MlaA
LAFFLIQSVQAYARPLLPAASGLQYFNQSGSISSDEDIPMMAETVVEGEVVDPFDEDPHGSAEDPWESFNEDVFDFNYGFYRHLMKPVAKGYNAVVPPDLQVSIDNAFDNLGFVSRFLNSLFQGKYERAGIETKRFLINTTLGVGGLFDVARYAFDTEAPPSEDTGQTLAVHGVSSGPFLMLPFLPPLTVRDAVGFAGDIFLNPVNYIIPILPNLGMNAEDTINTRALTIETFEGIEESTVDLYGAVRSGYFQMRSKEISE